MSSIHDHLKSAIKLTKWAIAESDKVLPEYMFKSDIQEFKNDKLLKHLRKAHQMQSDFRATQIGRFDKYDSRQMDRARQCQTPEVLKSNWPLQAQVVPRPFQLLEVPTLIKKVNSSMI